VRVVSDTNFTLGNGEKISGPLILLSINATLEEGSSVHGPVIMLCCNLITDGDVRGSVFLMSGNVMLGPYANVRGNVRVMNGNVLQSSPRK
jgi:cytoskeletal protein CcmA (bactofilin family)